MAEWLCARRNAHASLVDSEGKEVLHARMDMEPAVAFCDDIVHCYQL